MDSGDAADTYQFDLLSDFGDDIIDGWDRTEDILEFVNTADVDGMPGLTPDDIDFVSTTTDLGAGNDVILSFNSGSASGALVVFLGAGTGAISSITDLVDNASQIIVT